MSMTENNDNDNVSSDDNDNEETVEAASSFDLKSLGVEPMTTPIADLVKLYNENHGIVSSFVKKAKAGTSDPADVSNVVKSNLDKAKKSEDENIRQTVDNLRSIGSNLTTAFFEKTPVTTGLLQSSVLLEEIENLLSLAKDEYQYHLNHAIQSEKDRLGIKATPSEAATTAKLACIQLRTLIENRCNIAKLMGDENQIPSNLFKTEGQRKGFNTDVLPRTPRLDVEGNVSSSVTHLVFRFQPTGSETVNEVTETTLPDVAHNVVSKGSYRVTGQDISRMLKKAGHGIGATETEWSLEFPTGKLFGKKSV